MFRLIANNIKGFFDTTLFFTILAFGLFTILIDYPYFKLIKYRRDAIVTYTLGVTLIVLPFILLIISKF